ncbi:3-hydroxyacyl-ACP dehydratase FabZ family protein [Chitinophaga sp. 22321]|uniref:Beta-hydroxyacyl-ACP dehydratase n=1 Tax=Chitinophaga hostae TaxID=2831022 RepID=A0ABS5J5G2_9BACT|nr:3-hydroxyacyl-ACP dehydratase FabZ family protein [Chitinophaga hostae]MBS0030457.1 beta-hydroxyacyl-ACP dehydratase [Chitinophaga hostae]
MQSAVTNIEQLIPHRAPFLFVDEIISTTQEEIVGIKTFDDTDDMLKGSFPEFNFVPGVILIESMAQCGGAGIKILGLADGLFGLAAIETATFLSGTPYRQPVKYVIRNIRVSDKLIKQSGVAYVDEKPVMEARWLCIKIE